MKLALALSLCVASSVAAAQVGSPLPFTPAPPQSLQGPNALTPNNISQLRIAPNQVSSGPVNINAPWPVQQTPQQEPANSQANGSQANGSQANGSQANAQIFPSASTGAPTIGDPSNTGVSAPVPEPARPPVEDNSAARLRWENDPVQSLRQSGGSQPRANARGFAHTASLNDRIRLAEWKAHLQNTGVPAQKIDFEAKRLSKEQFELWASRFVWWENSVHPSRLETTASP